MIRAVGNGWQWWLFWDVKKFFKKNKNWSAFWKKNPSRHTMQLYSGFEPKNSKMCNFPESNFICKPVNLSLNRSPQFSNLKHNHVTKNVNYILPSILFRVDGSENCFFGNKILEKFETVALLWLCRESNPNSFAAVQSVFTPKLFNFL